MGKEYINMLLTAYFMILGVTAITNLFSSFFASFASTAAQKRFKKISFSLPFSKEPVEWKITKFDIYGLLIGLQTISLASPFPFKPFLFFLWAALRKDVFFW